MFLSADQLQQLTGYRKPTLQRRWLLDNGYHFDVRADGRPVVLVAQVTARQLKDLRGLPGVSEEPNFEALRSESSL